MKKLIIVLFCLAAAWIGAADEAAKPEYRYRGVEISQRSFKKLFVYFKDKFFTLPDGKVVSPVGEDGELKKISISKDEIDSGEISGKIVKVVDKNTFIIKAKEYVIRTDYVSMVEDKTTGKKTYQFNIRCNGKIRTTMTSTPEYRETKYYITAISSVDTSKLFKGEDFTANVAFADYYDEGGQHLRKFEVLKPVSEAEFKKYLDENNILYRYVKQPDGYAACEKCGGKGCLPNPDYKKGKLASKTIDCPACVGGRIRQYKTVKVPLKAPRRKNQVTVRN
ncbi:MAG: hypothetical protein PHH77_05275 [Victivallaceae bacterium]|nr:hypothetical protein [Victivallaceae bacterium]